MEIDGIVGRITDNYGNRRGDFPLIVRGTDALLALRLFKSGNVAIPYVANDFADIVSWDFAVADDFNLSTAPQLRSIGAFAVVDVVEQPYSGVEIQIPLPDINTEELIAKLGTAPSITLGIELSGFAAGNSKPVIVIQSQIIIYNRRAGAGTGNPTQVPDGSYNAAQVDALMSAKLDKDFAILDTKTALVDADAFAANDSAASGNPIVMTALKVWNYIKGKLFPGSMTIGNLVEYGEGGIMVDSGKDITDFAAASDLSAHTGNVANPHAVTKTQVGLSNVDNTSDANKPGATGPQGPAGADASIDITLNTQTGTTYTLQASDKGKVVELSNAAAIVHLLPNNLPVGWSCTIVQAGAGQVTLSAQATGSMRQAGGYTKLRAPWAQASLYVRSNAGGSSAEWVVSGEMA